MKLLDLLSQKHHESDGEYSPQDLLAWAVEHAKNPIITTNFGPDEAVLLHMATQIKPDIKVLWVDSGFNIEPTYLFAQALTTQLNLNLTIYTPEITASHWQALHGRTQVDDEKHAEFTQIYKLRPFKQALADISPDLWLTALRAEQTDFRKELVKISRVNEIVKLAPLLDWTASDMQTYLNANQLPNESRYYDPTKAEVKRECGLHTLI